MDDRRRQRLAVTGVVQGVGFRPFLHRLALSLGITGWARNREFGVEIEVEGTPEQLWQFRQRLPSDAPVLAQIEKVTLVEEISSAGYLDFQILESLGGAAANTQISPDIGICENCLAELRQKGNRRFRYPFINCTDCGPRFSIIKNLPYDRAQTTMSVFPMCPECAEEYGDITTRRYHAQPDCCSKCGPKVWYETPAGERREEAPFAYAQRLLAQGRILGVKGIGGIHLACNAADTEGVARLRQRKHRPHKALAVLCRDMDTVKRLCKVSPAEEVLLKSPAYPIVLLEKQLPQRLSHLSTSSRLGVMLPYTPLHTLLLDGSHGGPDTIVLTSANSKGEPVQIQNVQAMKTLSGIADGSLLHNRTIQNRCDDSVVALWQDAPYFFRRSRGYVPGAVPLLQDATGILAVGAEQKGNFALGRGENAYPSPYIGDISSLPNQDWQIEGIKAYSRLFGVTPSFFVCDRHPDYASSQWAAQEAKKQKIPLLRVQHHWAHMAACMADNALAEPCFGIIWDGTGLGEDNTIWGGECLLGDYRSFRRVGSIHPVQLPGGDRAITEIHRIALSLVYGADALQEQSLTTEQADLVGLLIHRVASPAASSIGRLFDGVYALLTGCREITYQGQAAMELEALGEQCQSNQTYSLDFYQEHSVLRFDWRPMLREIIRDKVQGVPASLCARAFENTLCQMALAQCKIKNPEKLPVVLSGGVFQNLYLLKTLVRLLAQAGFRVYTHHRVSANDEGICLGQLAIAQRSERYVSGYAAENY